MDMATTMSVTLRADGLKPCLSSGKGVSVFTATAFELDKKTAESVGLGLDILTVA